MISTSVMPWLRMRARLIGAVVAALKTLIAGCAVRIPQTVLAL
jgi:hypothetical protein